MQDPPVIGRTAALARILDLATTIDRKLDTIMASQDDLDAAAGAILDAVNTLSTETGELFPAVDAINEWIAAHPDLDTTGLEDAVTQLSASADAIKAAADAAEAAAPPTIS